MHDLLTFQQITVLPKARGATLFACDLQVSSVLLIKLLLPSAPVIQPVRVYWTSFLELWLCPGSLHKTGLFTLNTSLPRFTREKTLLLLLTV